MSLIYSVFENKGYFHLDAILGDMSFIIDNNLMRFSIHAALTLVRVFWAHATPALMASSKLLVEEALISVTRATVIGKLLSIG